MATFSWANRYGDDDEENEEESGYGFHAAGRDGLIFLIDTTPPMFEEQGDESPFELCIKCAKSVMQNKIISSDKDLIGVVFFGTEKAENPSDFKHIWVLQNLDQPGAPRILELEEFLEDGNNDFDTRFGHSTNFSLSDALWTCQNMFSNSPQKVGSKRIMLFTNNDDPHEGNRQLQNQAKTKAADLHETAVDLELMHIQKPGEAFDVAKFYKDLLFYDDDELTAQADPAEKFEELLTRVRSKDHKKRALGRIQFSLGKDFSLSVGIYNLVRHCAKPSAVRLYKKTNEEVKSVTDLVLKETGELLMPQDKKKSAMFGGKKIALEPEELKDIKTFGDPGLTLMGFKPISGLKRYHYVQPAQFIYPDESSIQGSTTAFTALLKKCLERQVVAICKYMPRKSTPPRFVALVPQKEELDEHKVQVTPPGFHLIPLPYADDLRTLKYEDTPRANPDQIDKAKEIIKKLQFKFSSESFENPALQNHYRNVEALALDRDTPEEMTDYTLPDNDRIEKRAGKLIEDFKDLVFPEGYVAGKKRKGGSAAGAGAKRAKTDLTEEIDFKKEAKAGRLGKLTVAVLKEFVKKANLKPDSQKKADLIDAISDHFGVD